MHNKRIYQGCLEASGYVLLFGRMILGENRYLG